MDNISAVQKDLLQRKIKEYFSNNPIKKAAIFETNVGGKVFWKVVRNKSGFDITEVKTRTASYQLREAGPLPGDDKFKKEPPPSDKTNARGETPPSVPYSNAGLGALRTAGIPKPMGPTRTNILPGNPKGTAPTPQKMGPASSNSAFTKSMPTAGRKPEPMDDPGGLAQPMSKDTQKQVNKYQTGTQKMLSWNPGNFDGDFAKTLTKSKDVAGTLKKMPADHFKRNFGWTGAQNAAQLVGNKDLYNKALDFMSQHNPLVAQLTGRKQRPGTKTPPKMPLSAGAKNENYQPIHMASSGQLMTEASPAFAAISAAFTTYMTNQNDHKAASDFVNVVSREKAKVTNPTEKKSVEDIERDYMGPATKKVDATTASTPFGSGHVAGAPKPGGVVAASRSYTGGLLREDDDKKPKKEKHEPKDKTQGGGEAELSEPTTSIKNASDVEDPEGIEDTEEPEAPSDAPAAPEPTAPKKSPEETVLGDRLGGQTIKSASIQLKPQGGALSLELTGMKIPATLVWDSAGKVIFTFKNRPYILRHG